jgi:hypothetical protein
VTIPTLFTNDGYLWDHPDCANSGYCPHPDVVDFTGNGTFMAVSLGINSVLLGQSETVCFFSL